ncbi:exodeoxyribonuclease I [Methylogaea oryzae]|uniref:exodeoxyribonuclease I n=1 Tax=Methylogaea oryzae TaxID=1295382 RepID=UPI000AF0BE63|nr:exodeoxyribonuclease I [Methylogaea oryzae]
MRPAPDYLPDPIACLITGITPQVALEKGLGEADFAALIHGELSRPQTCALGYNTIRFDDEVTRHLLYRNLYDPYAREWQNGNSRWDLIDLARAARALRPDGVLWPEVDGQPSLKLEHLTAANGLAHEAAHDALSDVYATIALAKLLREKQPKLFEFIWKNHGKQAAAGLLGLGTYQPLLHVSGMYPSARGNLAVVVALAADPVNNNGVVVFDLSADPEPLLTLSAEAIRQRLYTASADLPEGVERIALKTVHINKSPVLAPMNVLRPQDAERWGIDPVRCGEHLHALQNAVGLAEKLREVFAPRELPANDVDVALYDGFIGDGDKALLNRLRAMDPWELAEARPAFNDPRLPELLFRYRARNWPETLDEDEVPRWEDFRRKRLTEAGSGWLAYADYRQKLDAMRREYAGDSARQVLLDALDDYGRGLSA